MKRMIGIMLGSMLMVSAAWGGENGQGDAFWDNFLTRLQKVTPTRKTTSTTAVGGVRSAKNDETTDIYWKGREKGVEVGEDELEKLTLAMASRGKGDNREALRHFEEFLRDFPKSSLRADVLTAVETIRAEDAAAGDKAAPAQ